jgi:branched-chain amino acid transport system permease protein
MRYLLGVASVAGINLLATLGMVILTGYTGLFSVGHAGFMAIGAYTSAILVMRLKVPFLLALLAGGILAALLSLLIGYPSLRGRMRGDYFAISMLGFGESIRLILSNTTPVIGGAMGLPGIPQKTTFWYVLVIDILALIMVRNYVKSQWGRNSIAVREQEVAAMMMGVDTPRVKIWALAISAFFVGCSGGLWAFFMTYIQPLQFAQTKSSDLLASVVFGGINSITGPSFAAFFLAFVPELLREVAKWRLVAYGAIFVIIMIVRPQGLFGYRDIGFEHVHKILGKIGLNRRRDVDVAP